MKINSVTFMRCWNEDSGGGGVWELRASDRQEGGWWPGDMNVLIISVWTRFLWVPTCWRARAGQSLELSNRVNESQSNQALIYITRLFQSLDKLQAPVHTNGQVCLSLCFQWGWKIMSGNLAKGLKSICFLVYEPVKVLCAASIQVH